MPKEELIKENVKLKEILELKSDLISISAHELRTSLAAMKWILKMFIDKDLGEINTEQEDLLKKTFERNEQLIELVNEMISVNRTEDATITYTFKDTDIIRLIEDVTFEFIGESYKLGIAVIFLKPAHPIPPLKIDATKIRVVFQNLIENAIKYSNTGDKVFISIQEKPDAAEFSVKDNGIGIKEEDQEKIFSKFFRGENAKLKKETGTGLGLLAVKNIIERHNGKIWFESKENQGSTFFFSIPLSTEPIAKK